METKTGHLTTWLIALTLIGLLIYGSVHYLRDITATYQHAMTVNTGLPMP